MTSKTFIKNVEHESAIKHVTGRAIYTDDISEPRNLLHAAIGFSPASKGIIEKIDYSEVLNSDGVIDILDVVSTVNCILSGECSWCSDYNGDGLVDVLDIVVLISIILEV